MQILIVGVGALGGTIAARAIRSGLPVRLAARNNDSAKALRRSGLRVSGIGGEVRADAIDVAAVEDYGKGDQFDLILLATWWILKSWCHDGRTRRVRAEECRASTDRRTCRWCQ